MKLCHLFIAAASLCAFPGYSQEEEVISVDTAQFVNGVSIYFDYGKLTSLLSEQSTKWEGGVGVFIKKHWKAEVEYGIANLKPRQAFEEGSYTSDGAYYRVGFDYIMQVNPTANLGIGMRYGVSNFEDSGFNPADTLSPSFSRQNLTADWFEAIIESESELGKGFFLGLKIRIRFLNSYTQFAENDVYAIPGYGRTFDKSTPAVNLFIKYKIGFGH